jgi:rhodanese-related sulfurtransferase
MCASFGNTKPPASKVPSTFRWATFRRAHQEIDPDDHVVVLCHHGVRSLTVTNWLRQQGYEKVQSMRGGIDGWARTVDPKVPLY